MTEEEEYRFNQALVLLLSARSLLDGKELPDIERLKMWRRLTDEFLKHYHLKES